MTNFGSTHIFKKFKLNYTSLISKFQIWKVHVQSWKYKNSKGLQNKKPHEQIQVSKFGTCNNLSLTYPTIFNFKVSCIPFMKPADYNSIFNSI